MEIEHKAIIAKARTLKGTWTIDYVADWVVSPRSNYKIVSSWKSTSSQVNMHQIVASHKVLDWLESEHSQFGIKNPSWWKVNGKININETMFTLLTLKFSE